MTIRMKTSVTLEDKTEVPFPKLFRVAGSKPEMVWQAA